MKYILVFSTIVITIISSMLVDYSADLESSSYSILLFLFGLVLFVNAAKFLFWGWIHKNYDVSKSYPLTAIFFPLVLVISYLEGETSITIVKVIGTLLILFGMITLGGGKKQIETAKQS